MSDRLGMGLSFLGTEDPAIEAIGGDVDIEIFLVAVHQTGEGGEQIMGVGGTGVGLGMVLHRENGVVEQGDALRRAVVEVDVSELDSPETLVVDDRGDTALRPETQIIDVLGHATGKLGDEWTEGVEKEPESVVLGRDLNASGAQVHHRLVSSAVAELELLHGGTARKRNHLM